MIMIAKTGLFSVLAGVVLLAAPASGTAARQPLAVDAPPATEMQQYVEAMQPGWNLGNTFEASGNETSWGNPETTRELIARIAEEGYRSIRIPITWNHRTGPAPDYAVQPEFLARVAEVVDWSLDAGLHVMINLHHDSHWVQPMAGNSEAVLSKFSAIWTQVAAYFKDYPHELSFESLNEPRFSEDWGQDSPEYFSMLGELNTAFHRIVRGSGSLNEHRPLVLSTMTAAPSQARLEALNNTMEGLNDRHLIATIHFYGLYPFSVNYAGYTTFNDEVKQDLINAFDRTYNMFTAQGVPVIVGEFGLLGFDKFVGTIQQGEKLKFIEFLTYYAKEKGFTHMLWDNGQHFDRRKLSWFDDELGRLLKASISGRSSTASTDTIYIREGEAFGDVELKLNLNGNALSGIRSGERNLAEGEDFELDGELLTFKAELLRAPLGEERGDATVLTASFSAGADWTIHLVRYDIPQLSNANLLTTGSSIPARFNGDKLATMEAVYPTGGNAGPESWTSFKEFGASFLPDYEAGVIKLLPRFFDDVNDGEIRLKFHFWSGQTVDYTLVKEGMRVEGIAVEPPAEEETPVPSEAPSELSAVSEEAEKENRDVASGDDASDGRGAALWIALTAGFTLLAAGGWTAYRLFRRGRDANTE